MGATSETTIKILFSVLDLTQNSNFCPHLLDVFKTRARLLSNHRYVRTSQLGLFLCCSAHAHLAPCKPDDKNALALD